MFRKGLFVSVFAVLFSIVSLSPASAVDSAANHNPNFSFNQATVHAYYNTQLFSSDGRNISVEARVNVNGDCVNSYSASLYRLVNGDHVQVGDTKWVTCAGTSTWIKPPSHLNYWIVLRAVVYSGGTQNYVYAGNVYYNGHSPS